MKLKGLSVIISGANQGLGLEIAKACVREGANVAVCARQAALLEQVAQELTELAQGYARVLAEAVDVSCPKQVFNFVNKAVTTFGKVDVLIANAGIYGPKGPSESVDWEEWSHAIDINLKGTVLQCRAIVPHFKQHHAGKIIILSGGGATKPLPFLSAYAASKAGVVRFAETLAEELKEFNIDVNTVAPGALNTRLLDEVLAAGPEKVGQAFYEQSLKQKQQGGTPLQAGAELCVFLCSAVSEGISGKLISAVWDPWIHLPNYLEELKKSDVYTLRRVTPEDRELEFNE